MASFPVRKRRSQSPVTYSLSVFCFPVIVFLRNTVHLILYSGGNGGSTCRYPFLPSLQLQGAVFVEVCRKTFVFRGPPVYSARFGGVLMFSVPGYSVFLRSRPGYFPEQSAEMLHIRESQFFGDQAYVILFRQ